MTFPAKGLPELVPAQPEGERLRVDRLLRLRHLHFDQTIDAARVVFGRSKFDQQLVACQLLALQFPKPSPETFEATLADGTFLLPASLAAGQNVEFSLARR